MDHERKGREEFKRSSWHLTRLLLPHIDRWGSSAALQRVCLQQRHAARVALRNSRTKRAPSEHTHTHNSLTSTKTHRIVKAAEIKKKRCSDFSLPHQKTDANWKEKTSSWPLRSLLLPIMLSCVQLLQMTLSSLCLEIWHIVITQLWFCVWVCVLLHKDKCKSKYISKSVTVIVEVPRTTCLPLCVSDAGPSELSPTRLLSVSSRN